MADYTTRQCPRCKRRRLMSIKSAYDVLGRDMDKSFQLAIEGAIRMNHTVICEYCKQSYPSETHEQGTLDNTVEIERCQTTL